MAGMISIENGWVPVNSNDLEYFSSKPEQGWLWYRLPALKLAQVSWQHFEISIMF